MQNNKPVSISANPKRALFLDRDGVINKEKEESYIFNLHEFEFYPNALQAVVHLSKLFDYIFIVTNQRGIGRGLMTTEQLSEIHDFLKNTVCDNGGKIDAIFFAPSSDKNHPDRKPNTGMALQAQQTFSDIDFKQSIMVGNNLSDMQFGKSMQMQTVFLSTTQSAFELPHPLIDLQYDSLFSFAATL